MTPLLPTTSSRFFGPACRFAALAVGLAALLAGCATAGGGPARSGGPVHVVAVENVWGDIARQIGGEHVAVTSILRDPNADPHSYESDPADAAALGAARLVVENGLGYDDFADKLLSAGRARGRTVLTVSQVAGSRADANPHLWYSPDHVRAAAQAIAASLAAADPADAAAYRANLAGFLTGYQPYADTLATIRARYAGTPVAYTERVPGYLLEAAGLRLATPASFAQSIEDGNEPGPADTDAMDTAMTSRRVRVLLYNAQVTTPVTARVQALARAAGVPVVGVAETLPAAERDFQTWQTDQARAVLAALGG